ncbi:uncharacterized protein BDV17DRAFT_294725 [Aspergillus undulatus]|uniref:uncharacterized protein n=1 Tax=Aspergillus undulatus TaxID=1810928 RepID=UPI003CCD914F
MDLFGSSPAAPARPLSEVDSGAVDIPFDSQGSSYAMVDEKAFHIIDADNKRLDGLMGKFTKGFDPGAFGDTILASLPWLAKNVFPGSFAHLLLLLFQSFEAIEHTQFGLENWLGNNYHGTPIIQPSKNSASDETFFVAEMQMLRRLLEPIREGTNREIFWLNTRRADPAKTCEQLEASIRTIEMFKDDICEALQPGYESRTIYNDADETEWPKMFSLRQIRLDTCKATLQWDSFNGSEIELTKFFQHYKSHISANEPAKARASGWLPPKSPGTPRQSSTEARDGDLVSWASHGVEDRVLDLVLRTALWLSLARGFAAVQLFCHVARLFVLKPPKNPRNEYYCFLLHLIRLRAASRDARLSPSPMVPGDDKAFPARNTDYFEDVARAGHKLSSVLYDDISLSRKRDAQKPTLSSPSARRRSGHGYMQSVAQASVDGSLTGIASSSDEESIANDTTDEDDLPDFSPQTSFVFRNTTI